MNKNPFRVEFSIKSGQIEIRDNVPDGSVRFPCLLEEARELAPQWLAAIEKADKILSGPLLNVKLIDQVVEKANEIPRAEDVHPAHVMVDYYHASLQLFSDIAVAADRARFRGDRSALNTCLEIIELMLEQHKHHLPESGPARHP